MSNYKRMNGEEVSPVITYLTDEQKCKLKAYCAINKITMSSYIKQLILEELKVGVV